MPKNLVYFGSPEFSAKILESLLKNPEIRVVGVVSQPDKPVGRKQTLTPSPVSSLAAQHDLPTYKPTNLDSDNLSHISLLKPDIFLVVSYGLFMPSEWLSAPTIGTFNFHFSLLPKYRGALCIQEAIKNQERETGVTLMVMDKQMDHGPIINQIKVSIDPNENVKELTTKLTQAGIEILERNLPEICAQKFTSTPQNETLATFTPSLKTLTHQNAFIPWEKLCQFSLTTNALINSLNPQPGAWTTYHDQELKILQTKVTGNKFEIETVQVPSKTPISWKNFLSGHENK